MSGALERIIDTIPKSLQPSINPVLFALICAIAKSDNARQEQVLIAKDQIFVRTATGDPLNRIANSLGVSRPRNIGLSDEKFQELIPNLSLKPKQIKKAFYDTADVFWGPLFSRANVTSGNSAPFDISTGDILRIRVDNGEVQELKILPGDLALDGAATVDELVTLLQKIDGITASSIDDSVTSSQKLNIRTNTVGSAGGLEILDSTMVDPLKLNFTVGTYDILDLDQRVSIYDLNPNELIIEIPAIVPTVRRTLLGSHHFHADSTLEPPKGTAQGKWQGSFLFDPNATEGSFTVTSQVATLTQDILKGEVYTSIQVDDTSLFENPSGDLIFSFGIDDEFTVAYRGIANNNTILIDPGHVFKKNHLTGAQVRVVSKREAHVPKRSGSDLAVYFTSPSGAREEIQLILERLKAAGIILKFVVLAPKFKYLIDNPYISDDDSAKC